MVSSTHAGRPAVGQVGQHLAPVVRRERPGGLGDVADDRHRAVERAAGHHPQLHGREVLHLVDDDVAVGPDLVLGAVGCCGWPGDRAARGPRRAAATSASDHDDRLTVGVPRAVQRPSTRRRPATSTAARRSRAREPNRSWSSSAGVSTGHIRSRASRTSSRWRGAVPHLVRRGLDAAAGGQRGRTPRSPRSAGRRCGGGTGAGPPSRCGRCRRRSAAAWSRRRGRPGPPAAGARGRAPPWPAPAPCGRRPSPGRPGGSPRRRAPRPARGRPGRPARRRPRRARAAPGRCSAGTPGWGRPRGRPGPRAGTGSV